MRDLLLKLSILHYQLSILPPFSIPQPRRPSLACFTTEKSGNNTMKSLPNTSFFSNSNRTNKPRRQDSEKSTERTIHNPSMLLAALQAMLSALRGSPDQSS